MKEWSSEVSTVSSALIVLQEAVPEPPLAARMSGTT